jgi:hypothetical protein
MTNDKGMVEWLQRLPEMAVKLPLDPDQIPDTFIYLIPERSRKPICYCRLDTRKDIVEKGLDQPPKWYPLKEDPSIDALDSSTFPGTRTHARTHLNGLVGKVKSPFSTLHSPLSALHTLSLSPFHSPSSQSYY